MIKILKARWNALSDWLAVYSPVAKTARFTLSLIGGFLLISSCIGAYGLVMDVVTHYGGYGAGTEFANQMKKKENCEQLMGAENDTMLENHHVSQAFKDRMKEDTRSECDEIRARPTQDFAAYEKNNPLIITWDGRKKYVYDFFQGAFLLFLAKALGKKFDAPDVLAMPRRPTYQASAGAYDDDMGPWQMAGLFLLMFGFFCMMAGGYFLYDTYAAFPGKWPDFGNFLMAWLGSGTLRDSGVPNEEMQSLAASFTRSKIMAGSAMVLILIGAFSMTRGRPSADTGTSAPVTAPVALLAAAVAIVIWVLCGGPLPFFGIVPVTPTVSSSFSAPAGTVGPVTPSADLPTFHPLNPGNR